MKANLIRRYLTIIIFLILGVLFIAHFGGPSILRLYIESGVGSCSKIPVLCMYPQEQLNAAAQEDDVFLSGLIPYDFPTIKISLPKGYTVVNERISKIYYKRKKKTNKDTVIYMLTEKPGFFLSMFPELKKRGINTDYDFYSHVMGAQLNKVNSINDAFFVIVKSIFTPNLGDQATAKIANIKIADKTGFLSYNREKNLNYYDCNIFDGSGNFIRIYIRDKGAKLTTDNVFSIISTIKIK